MRCQWLKAMAYPYDGVSFYINTLPPPYLQYAFHLHKNCRTPTYIQAFANVLITPAYLVLCLNINPPAVCRILWKNPVGCWSITIFITLNHSLTYTMHSTRMQTAKLRTYIQHVFANLVIRYQPKSCLKKKFQVGAKKSLLTSSLHKSFCYTMHFTHTQTAKHNIFFFDNPSLPCSVFEYQPTSYMRAFMKETNWVLKDRQLMLVAGATE